MSKKAKSELDEKDLKAMRKLKQANNDVIRALKEHEAPDDVAEAYEKLRLLLAPNFVDRLIDARRKEIERNSDAARENSSKLQEDCCE